MGFQRKRNLRRVASTNTVQDNVDGIDNVGDELNVVDNDSNVVEFDKKIDGEYAGGFVNE